MREQSFEGNYGRAVALDICHACNALWFDDKESLQLTPGSILRLFRIIHEKRAAHRNPLPDSMACPHCRTPLARVSDIQRGTRFTYARCPRGHGRFITFFEFLREKNFVRPMDAKQLKELKKHITMINCSNCGAPMDLNKGSACEFCRTPLSILDAQQVEVTVQELLKSEEKRKTLDPTLPVRLMMDKLRVDRVYGPEATALAGLGTHAPFGLVEAGVATVVEVLTELL
jgi:hypothetical protein